MTKDDLFFKIQTATPFEFTYNGKTYALTYDSEPLKDGKRKQYIIFGQIFEGKKFEDFGDLINNAKVENHFFREMLDIL